MSEQAPSPRDWLYWLRIAAAILGAAGVGFAIHVLYGRGWANDYVQHAADTGRLAGALREPYPQYVVVTAFVLALLPTAGKVVAYMLLRGSLPGKTRLTKGLWFGLLVMFMGDTLIRLPLMNAIIGNPLDVVFVQGLEGWLIGPLVGVVIALLVP